VTKGLNSELPAARALGVPHLIAHLEGRLSLEDAVAQAVAETRRYAKRQMTWFRHQMPDWTVVERSEPGEIAEIVGQVLE
jgi:tRNA dimethylallyltransferase